MRIFTEALLAAFAAMGIYMIFFALFPLRIFSLIRSDKVKLTARIDASCSAGELENTVRSLLRLRKTGFSDFDIEIKNLGLDEAALDTAKLLTREQGVFLTAPSKENTQWTREQASLKA